MGGPVSSVGVSRLSRDSAAVARGLPAAASDLEYLEEDLLERLAEETALLQGRVRAEEVTRVVS